MAGAREAIEALVGRYRTVAIVSGRRAEEVEELLAVPGVRYEGLYGMVDARKPSIALGSRAKAAAGAVPGAWVEDKGASLAVHYRQASEPARARAFLIAALEPIAAGAGLELIEGKMVLELVPADRPLKGGAVERLVGDGALRAMLYGGDDLADLDAFASIDRLIAGGLVGVKVAVRGAETPPALLDAADLVVEGPEGLVALLRQLA